MHLDFVRFVLFRVFPVLAFSTFLAPFVALSQSSDPGPPPALPQCARSFFDNIFSKCGPYAPPKDWYQPENECTIKAAEAFDLCKAAGYEARYILIDCDPAPSHAVVGCKIEGKWVMIDTTVNVRDIAVENVEKLLEKEEFKQEPPLESLMNGDTPIDQLACYLNGRDPRTACGCQKDPAGKTNCQCTALAESSVPASGPANTGFCSREQEMDPTGFSVPECKKCCKDRHKFLQDIEKPTCDAFMDGCAQSLLDDLKSPPGNPTGIIADNLYIGLMALWRCDQWPKQTQAFLEKCQQSCDANPGRLATITLLPRSDPMVARRGAIMTQLKDVPGAEGMCTIPNECELPLVKGKTLILTARPKDSSVQFIGWAGLCKGLKNPCSIVVSKPGTVIAAFGKRCALEGELAGSSTTQKCCTGLNKCANGVCRKRCVRKLTVQIAGAGAGADPGRVFDVAGKINCPGTCVAAAQPYGSSHTLMPTWYSDFEFVRWEGCTRASGIECTAVLNAPGDTTVRAIFKRACVPQCFGKGCGGDGCGGTCGQCAAPKTCNGNGICEDPYTLSLNMVMAHGARGSVSFVPAAPAVAACTNQCERQFPRDRNVTLTARATTTDGIFQGWSGACRGSDDTCTVLMNAAKNVTAKFDKLCVPQCGGRNCGLDTCGGSCGRCPVSQTCTAGVCRAPQQCIPDCTGKQCGPDECGGTCTNRCLPGQSCSAAGQCVPGSVCTPNCGTRTCGSNGCGEFGGELIGTGNGMNPPCFYLYPNGAGLKVQTLK
jgi:hypothetical protein